MYRTRFRLTAAFYENRNFHMNKLSRDDVQGCTNAAGAGSPGAVTAMDELSELLSADLYLINNVALTWSKGATLTP